MFKRQKNIPPVCGDNNKNIPPPSCGGGLGGGLAGLGESFAVARAPSPRPSPTGGEGDFYPSVSRGGGRKQRGFSIVEMGIALAVIGLILGGVLLPLSSQLRDRGIREEERKMEKIVEAVTAYAVRHKTLRRSILRSAVAGATGITVAPAGRSYLPCPDIDGDGVEDRTAADDEIPADDVADAGVCVDQSGALPWRDLGVPAADAWGNRYTYRVDIAFSSSVIGFGEDTRADKYDLRKPLAENCAPDNTLMYQERDADASERPLLVCAEDCTGSGTPEALGNVSVAAQDTACSMEIRRPYDEDDITDGLAFVVISHGPNGFGAINFNDGADFINCNNADIGEYEEQINTTAATSTSSSCQGSGGGMRVVKRPRETRGFDDIVLWRDGRHLIRKVREAGALPPADFPGIVVTPEEILNYAVGVVIPNFGINVTGLSAGSYVGITSGLVGGVFGHRFIENGYIQSDTIRYTCKSAGGCLVNVITDEVVRGVIEAR